MKKLILCYSYSGNTKKVADMVQKEIDSGFMPYLQALSVDLKTDDTIVLGTAKMQYGI